jgi:hypothetical protein
MSPPRVLRAVLKQMKAKGEKLGVAAGSSDK